MRQVTLMILTDKESELCRACPNIASVDGKDACYISDYRECECIKKLKDEGKKKCNDILRDMYMRNAEAYEEYGCL